MSDRQDGKPSKRASMSVAAAQVRDECRFWVRRMAQPIEAHETSVKAQHNKVARLTGIPPRRIKDYWHGYLAKIPAHEERTIRAAYQNWLVTAKARAVADLRQIEAENERLSNVVANYASARWNLACEAGAKDRAECGEEAAGADDGRSETETR